MSIYSEKIEYLINAALTDGSLTETERQILLRNAAAEGIPLDEFEMILSARLYELNQAAKAKEQAQVPQYAAPTSKSKSTKFGELHTCPACGEVVKNGLAVCQSCGYAFNEDVDSNAMNKLYERLEAINNKYLARAQGLFAGLTAEFDRPKIIMEKMNAIRMFSVPNTRADLLDLIAALQPLANPKGPKMGTSFGAPEDLSLAYWDLFANCINRARISFANDKDFEPYFEYYKKNHVPKRGLFGGIFGN